MAHTLPALPFKKDALAPHISEKTLEFHYGKHHAAYVNKLNELIQGTEFENLSLEEIIRRTRGVADKRAIFNNAAQDWNHTFFWNSLAADGGGMPKDGPLKQKLLEAFGSLEAFQTAFRTAAVGQFGSGWAWLTLDGSGKLAIVSSANADIPETPVLLTCDVWEHAYYLDYQNRRPDYVTTFLDHLVNWSFVEDNLKAA